MSLISNSPHHQPAKRRGRRATAALLALTILAAPLGLGAVAAHAGPFEASLLSQEGFSPDKRPWERPDWLNKAPRFANYFSCGEDYVNVGFLDPDGPTETVLVEVQFHYDSDDTQYTVAYYSSRTAAFGVGFANPEDVNSISVRATDTEGAWSGTTTADFDYYASGNRCTVR